jgi:large subunit ribosomal protein L10
MNRQQKESMVALLQQNFSSSAASFVVGVDGMTVEQLQSLRKQLRKESGRLQITKVRLMKRATQQGNSVDGFNAYLKNQIGLVFAEKEVSSVARLLCAFARENEQLKVIGGCMEASLLDTSMINMVASLPSREILLGQLAGTLQAPITGLAVVLHQLIARLAYVLKAIEEKKEQQS